MHITYENNETDILAYGRLIYDKSPTVKQHLRKAIKYAIFLILLIGTFIYFYESDRTTLYFWGVLSVAWLIYIPFQHKKKYLKNMLSTYQEDEHKNLFGKHQITLDDFGITDKIKNGINKTEWKKIEHVESIDNYIFIFIDSTMAYLIPKDRIIDGDFDMFIETIKMQQKRNSS